MNKSIYTLRATHARVWKYIYHVLFITDMFRPLSRSSSG